MWPRNLAKSVILSVLLLAPVCLAVGAAIPEYDIGQLGRFGIEAGSLKVELTPPAELKQPSPVGFTLRGSRARWSFCLTRETPDGAVDEPVMALSYEDPGASSQDGQSTGTLFWGKDYLAVSAVVRLDGKPIAVIYRAQADLRNVRLEVSAKTNEQITESLVDEYADSLQDLANAHAHEVGLYLAPILKKLTRQNLLGLGATDVYTVFNSLAPDPAVVEQLRRLLPALDSMSVRERDAASVQLANLGRAGVLAALRCDGAALSPEQRSRLTRFIESHRRRFYVSPELSRRDTEFLLACLEDDDPAVRQAAKQALQGALGQALSFDPGAGFDDRATAVQELKASLQAQTAGWMMKPEGR